jgi:hypothetical protein
MSRSDTDSGTTKSRDECMPRQPLSVSELAAAARSQRSSLYVWLQQNHDQFAQMLTDVVRPNWSALATKFGDHGLTDGEGNHPSAECTRQTWWKVRKAMKARAVARAKRQATPQSTPRQIPPPQPPASTPRPDVANPSMADIFADWDANAPKMPEPLR